ncbi:hypothetical protein ACFVVA_38190 [Kitasatospora sp. NPDC058048]|uniref:hypothetical protein n=1 Tax=Kitasatospora sp. NPDC058048 TaxID=3346313 RepID=UPI0036DA9B41
MTSAVPFSRSHPGHPEHRPGDAERAPRALMSGPGRCWDTEPRWRWVEIRLGGRWRPGRIESWRLHQGSTAWVALVRWGAGFDDWGWYLHHPDTIRQTPQPTDPDGPANW